MSVKLINLRKSKLIGISNLLNDNESAKRFFTNKTATLEIINLKEQDISSLQMNYLNAKGDLSSENPSDIRIYHNSYVNKRRNIYEFAIIRNLYFDRITIQLVAQNGDMCRIKDFLANEPKIAKKRKKLAYKSKMPIGVHFLREFSKEERKLCYKLKQRKSYKLQTNEIAEMYYDFGYSLNDVVEAYNINFYNINELLFELDEKHQKLITELQYYKECLEEEDNSF